jgi:hypothetical protein
MNCIVDRLKQRVRSESRPQVRNLRQGKVPRREVDPRYPH